MDLIHFGFVSHRGPGALCSRGAIGEGLHCSGSNTEQVRFSICPYKHTIQQL